MLRLKRNMNLFAPKPTLKSIFQKMGDVRSNAIVIIKSTTKFNALNEVIEEDTIS